VELPSSLGSVFCYLCGHRLVKEAPPEPERIKPKLKPKPTVKHVPIEIPESEIDDIVFNYIVQHGGTISISEAARDLNLTQEDLKASIERLRQAHKLE